MPRLNLPLRPDLAFFLTYSEAPDGQARRVPIGPVPLRIGRRSPCEILLGDSEVSGLHCEVCIEGQDVVVIDRGSTNGTFVDGQRVASRARLSSGASLLVGRQLIKFEVRDQRELALSEEINRDLERANLYVRSMLPPPMRSGPLRSEWYFQPSTKVGGDAFGYSMLDEHRLAGYMIDVSGHGVGAAMHVVAVMNTLRQRVLPDTDFADPAVVLSRLNALYPMDDHSGMLFSIWYGVYDLRTRELTYASGGHHPAYLVRSTGAPPLPLQTRCTVLGAMPDSRFHSAREVLEAGDRLYLFSDGVFEIATADGLPWGLEDLVPLLGGAFDPGLTEPEHLFHTVRRLARPGPLDDDFSIVVVKVL